MPITSTKNFRLSSGFGVSNSIWPRWARSKIGSGVMVVPLDERPRHVVEQFIHGEGSRNEPLLRDIADDHFQRTARLVGRKAWGRVFGGLRQQPMHLTHDLG